MEKVCSRCGVRKDVNFFYALPTGGYRSACKECIRSVEAMRQRKRRGQDKTPEPTPRFEGFDQKDGKVEVLNSCGHRFRYTIKQPQAVRWLETQPCPRCRKAPKRGSGSGSPSDGSGGSGDGSGDGSGESPEQAEAKAEADTSGESGGESGSETFDKPKPKPRAKSDPAWVDAIPLPDTVFHYVLPDIIRSVRANVPAWLQGPPGTSKSTIARQVADALGLGFYPVACHEMMTRSDLFGFTDANGTDHRTPLWNAYEYGGICLLDEVDNGNPNLLAALNSALSNGHCVFGSGTIVQRHTDFRVIATANTAGLGPEHGFIGRNGVDLATRDRFATFMVLIDNALEAALASMAMGIEVDVQPFAESARQRLLDASCNVPLSPDEILDNVRKVRGIIENRYRGTIVSPRATLHVGALVAERFSLKDAMITKLPGLDMSDIANILKEATL